METISNNGGAVDLIAPNDPLYNNTDDSVPKELNAVFLALDAFPPIASSGPQSPIPVSAVEAASSALRLASLLGLEGRRGELFLQMGGAERCLRVFRITIRDIEPGGSRDRAVSALLLETVQVILSILRCAEQKNCTIGFSLESLQHPGAEVLVSMGLNAMNWVVSSAAPPVKGRTRSINSYLIYLMEINCLLPCNAGNCLFLGEFLNGLFTERLVMVAFGIMDQSVAENFQKNYGEKPEGRHIDSRGYECDGISCVWYFRSKYLRSVLKIVSSGKEAAEIASKSRDVVLYLTMMVLEMPESIYDEKQSKAHDITNLACKCLLLIVKHASADKFKTILPLMLDCVDTNGDNLLYSDKLRNNVSEGVYKLLYTLSRHAKAWTDGISAENISSLRQKFEGPQEGRYPLTPRILDVVFFILARLDSLIYEYNSDNLETRDGRSLSERFYFVKSLRNLGGCTWFREGYFSERDVEEIVSIGGADIIKETCKKSRAARLFNYLMMEIQFCYTCREADPTADPIMVENLFLQVLSCFGNFFLNKWFVYMLPVLRGFVGAPSHDDDVPQPGIMFFTINNLSKGFSTPRTLEKILGLILNLVQLPVNPTVNPTVNPEFLAIIASELATLQLPKVEGRWQEAQFEQIDVVKLHITAGKLRRNITLVMNAYLKSPSASPIESFQSFTPFRWIRFHYYRSSLLALNCKKKITASNREKILPLPDREINVDPVLVMCKLKKGTFLNEEVGDIEYRHSFHDMSFGGNIPSSCTGGTTITYLSRVTGKVLDCVRWGFVDEDEDKEEDNEDKSNRKQKIMLKGRRRVMTRDREGEKEFPSVKLGAAWDIDVIFVDDE